MKPITLIVALLLIFAAPRSAIAEGAAPPRPRALVVSIDGLRPDLLLRADCPNIRALMARGSFTMWAQTTPMDITLPSHVSMMTGRRVEFHGVSWNDVEPPTGVEYRYPQVPTLFELAKASGYTTALVSGKLKFRTLARPGSVDWLALPQGKKEDDGATTDAAVQVIHEHQPQVMLLHLAQTDTAGHAGGWGSAAQVAVIEAADRCVGRVVAALAEAGVLEETLIIVTADHGGWAKIHNGSDPRGLHIPWIVAGPGVRKDYDLTQEKDLVVHTEDTFANCCRFLGLMLPEKCDGKVVEAAIEAWPEPVEVRR